MERDCDERCTCNRGEWICEPRCKGSSYPRGSQRTMANPHCQERIVEEDECCRVMECVEPLLEPSVATADLAGMPAVAAAEQNEGESSSDLSQQMQRKLLLWLNSCCLTAYGPCFNAVFFVLSINVMPCTHTHTHTL